MGAAGPLLLRNLRHLRTLLVALSLGLLAFEVMIVHFAAAFETGPGLDQLFALMPEMLRRIIGAQIGELTFPAMVAFGFQHPMLLVAGIALMVVCGTIPAGDREAGTLDLFLARPIARRRYVAAALGCVVAGALSLSLGLLLGNVIGLATVKVATERPWTDYVPIAFGLFSLLLALGCIALLFGTGAGRRGTAVARVVGLTLVLYLFESFGEVSAVMGALRWVSPFHYFSPVRALLLAGTPWYHTPVLLGMAAATSLLALLRFDRTDA